jgi:TolB-like protein
MQRPFPAYSGDEPYIFVSYAHDDAALVYPEITRLRNEGFNIWYDEGINPGSTWRDEVALALTQCSLFLYFMTPRSVASPNCLNEVNFSLSRERKILSVHLEQTELPIGLELSLSAMQAIIRADHAVDVYGTKLTSALNSLLPTVIEPVAITGVQLTERTADDTSIAILPFVNRSDDPNNEYLCDGIAEELITGLAKIEGLRLASQLSSFGLKGQNLEPGAIGQRLRVSNVLTGSIQKSGERVRITTTLSETATGSVLWSERYDGTLEDVFELQEDVANKVIDALKIELQTSSDEPTIDTGTRNTRAYQSFLLGKHEYFKNTRTAFISAHGHFADSLRADPNFGRACWLDFRVWLFQRNNGYFSQEDIYTPASQILERIKQIDFEPPMPVVWIERFLEPSLIPDERTQAEEALEKVREEDKAWHGFQLARLGNSLISAGLLNGAREFWQFYLRRSAIYARETGLDGAYGQLLFALGRFDKAEEHFTRMILNEPGQVLMVGTRTMIYSRTGQYEKSTAGLAELARVFPRNFAQFYDLYWRRELDAARAYFDWMDGQRNLQLIFKIWGCFLLGYIEKGMDYLEQLNPSLYNLRVFALYALTPSIIREVTSHPRYKALLAAYDMDDDWRDELMTRVNELEHITGIHVSLDEDY